MQQWFTTSEARISATIRDDFKEVDQADEVTPGDEVTPIYGIVKSWIRTKISFSLLRTMNLCIRGSRTKTQHSEDLASTNIIMAVMDTRSENQP